MLRRSSPLVLASLAILVLASVPRVAAADQYDRSAWEFTLAGTGASDKDLENNTVGADIGLGVFLGPFELGVRQSINYASVSSPAGDDDSFSGSTRAFADFELEIGSFAPFIGANIGYVYGDFVKDQFIAGPEAGLKIYFHENHDVFIFGRIEYQFFFEDSDQADDAFEDGQFVYTIGVGFRF
jgi:hypothetical protein